MCSCFPLFAGLIQDPGFEPPLPTQWGFAGSGAGSSASIFGSGSSYPTPHSGSKQLRLEIRYDAAGNTAYAYQSLAAVGGEQWTFSGYMINWADAAMQPNSYGLIEMVFTGSFSGESRFNSGHLTPSETLNSANWSLASVTGTAPEGSQQVTLYLKIIQDSVPETFNGSGYGSLWFDDVNATAVAAVPEPVSAGLFAVLLVGLAVGGRLCYDKWRHHA